MKKTSIFLLLISVFSLQSCFNIIEELTLNKKGDGVYKVVVDMGPMMTNGMMKEMFLQSLKEDTAMASSLVDGKLEMDTVISLKDSPMGDQLSGEMPAILEKVKMHMNLSESKGDFLMTINLDFDKLSEISEFYAAMEEAGGDEGLGGMIPGGALFEMKGKKSLVRKPMSFASLTDEAEGNEEMEMMKMFMSGATYKTVYNLPKKVKKTSFKDAEVKGKTITISHSYLDVMDGKVDLSGMIKY